MINFLKQIAFNCWQVTSFYRKNLIDKEELFPVNKFIQFLIEYKKSIIFFVLFVGYTMEKLTIRDKWHYEVSNCITTCLMYQ